MPRKYDASRRTEAAERTREVILSAAFTLHGLGVFDFESLAREAGVSLATVRKHFPNRDALYGSCTAWGMEHVAVIPDMELLTSTRDARQRTRLVVAQTYAFYESLFGQLWGTFSAPDDSPVLAEYVAEYEKMLTNFSGLVLECWPGLKRPDEARGTVRGFLSFHTYYALRHDGGLTPEQATSRISEALLRALESPGVGKSKEAIV